MFAVGCTFPQRLPSAGDFYWGLLDAVSPRQGALKTGREEVWGRLLSRRPFDQRFIASTYSCSAVLTRSHRDKAMTRSEEAKRATTTSARPRTGAKPLCLPGDRAGTRDTPGHFPPPDGTQGYDVSALIPSGGECFPGRVGDTPGKSGDRPVAAMCRYMSLAQSRRERSCAALSEMVELFTS